MKTTTCGGLLARGVLAACLAWSVAQAADAQPAEVGSAAESASRSEPGGVPVTELITAVAKRTGKKFLVDSRVRTQVSLAGMTMSAISFNDLVTLLHLNGYAVVETGGAVWVAPDPNARTMPSPLLTEKETRPDAEIVTDTLQLKSIPAAQLVPILRPLFPQYAHFAADLCANTLIIVDTFANVKRIEAIARRMDVGEPLKPHVCEAGPPNPPRELPPREPAPPGR
jgi:type II secretory pathway component GspD/PulD (secretin)